MKRLIIEQLKEGFLFTDENDDDYAVSSGSLSKRVSAYFGMTRPDSKRKQIAPPVVAGKDARQCPETQGNMTADSHSAGATSQLLSTERVEVAPLGGDALANENPKLGTPDNILRPSDLKIAKFDYDDDKMQQYKSLRFLELPDGRVVLDYAHSRYYSTKGVVMQIPFPFPGGLFSKENGWSSSVEQAFKMYRRHLAEQKEPEGLPEGTCDDVSFDTCANNDPEACKFCVDESRYEDKRKLAARKRGAPLLKASMGV